VKIFEVHLFTCPVHAVMLTCLPLHQFTYMVTYGAYHAPFVTRDVLMATYLYTELKSCVDYTKGDKTTCLYVHGRVFWWFYHTILQITQSNSTPLVTSHSFCKSLSQTPRLSFVTCGAKDARRRACRCLRSHLHHLPVHPAGAGQRFLIPALSCRALQ
jgi:hypothetical protein